MTARPLLAFLVVAGLAAAPCLCLAGGRTAGGESGAAATPCHAATPAAQVSAAHGCDCCVEAPSPGLVPERLAPLVPSPADLVAAVSPVASPPHPARASAGGGRGSPPAPPPTSIRVLRV